MIEIRRAHAADVDLVAPLFDAYRQFYGRTPDLALARRFLADRLGRAESVVFLAVTQRDGRTVGCGFTQLYRSFSSLSCRPMWLLADLFVAPEARRSGTGRRLMEAAHTIAQEHGAVTVELETAHTNTAAQALYESMGYQHDLEFRHYVLSLPQG
jgi:ribosomal protein S18 acetylase RimI-like enzyme